MPIGVRKGRTAWRHPYGYPSQPYDYYLPRPSFVDEAMLGSLLVIHFGWKSCTVVVKKAAFASSLPLELQYPGPVASAAGQPMGRLGARGALPLLLIAPPGVVQSWFLVCIWLKSFSTRKRDLTSVGEHHSVGKHRRSGQAGSAVVPGHI